MTLYLTQYTVHAVTYINSSFPIKLSSIDLLISVTTHKCLLLAFNQIQKTPCLHHCLLSYAYVVCRFCVLFFSCEFSLNVKPVLASV